jgi:hypothetical protein
MAPFDRVWKLRQAWRRSSGRARCTAQGCDRTVAIRCFYVDRRERVCATTWCIRHGAMFNDNAYCRRHAGTVAALSNGFYQLALPDLDNRAPSLVGWMSDELDAPIRAALQAAARPGTMGETTLVADPVRLITPGLAAQRCWARSWKLVDHLGVVHQVSIEVEEEAQAVVAVRVDHDLIGRSVPPWIERSPIARVPTADEDAASRSAFNAALARSVQAFLSREEIASGF